MKQYPTTTFMLTFVLKSVTKNGIITNRENSQWFVKWSRKGYFSPSTLMFHWLHLLSRFHRSVRFHESWGFFGFFWHCMRDRCTDRQMNKQPSPRTSTTALTLVEESRSTVTATQQITAWTPVRCCFTWSVKLKWKSQQFNSVKICFIKVVKKQLFF